MKQIDMNRAHTTQGFTLVEMLVAVALFSIVLLISLGSIMTIVDVNKKSQTLTTVMNDLNFTFENITRSLKTGRLQIDFGDSGDYSEITVETKAGPILTYAWDEANKRITRQQGNDSASPITSDQIEITSLFFRVFYDGANRQPRILIVASGTASVGGSISSDFTIQSTVSQRDLETEHFK